METNQSGIDKESVASRHPDEIDLLDYVEVILRRRRVIFGTILAFIVAASFARLTLDEPPYVAEINVRVVGADFDSPAYQDFEDDLNQVVLDRNIPIDDVLVDSISIQAHLGTTVRQSLESLTQIAEITKASGGFVSVIVHQADSIAAVGILDAYLAGLEVVAVAPESELVLINRRLEETNSLIQKEEGVLAERWRSASDSLLALSTLSLGAIEDSVRMVHASRLQRARVVHALRLQRSDEDLRIAEDSLVSFREGTRVKAKPGSYLGLEQELKRRERMVASAVRVRDKLGATGYNIYDGLEVLDDEKYNELFQQENRLERDIAYSRQINIELRSGGMELSKDAVSTNLTRELQSLSRSYDKLVEQKVRLLDSNPGGQEIRITLLSREVRQGKKDHSTLNWLAGGILAGLSLGVLLAFFYEFLDRANLEGRLENLRRSI